MKHPVISAQKRTILGKKIKTLRREGILPANVYGKDLASTAVQVNQKEFDTVYNEVGETGLVDLTIEGEVRPVLIKNLQMQYPLRIPLHVDFYQVNLKEKVKTMVPLAIVGEPKAVTEKIGLLLQPLSEVGVEALPESLPENIEVNVEHLANLDEQITVGDLHIPDGVTVHTDPGQTVAKIAELVVEEPEPEETPEEAEGAETADAEGEVSEASKESQAEGAETTKENDKTEEKSNTNEEKKEN